MAWQMYLPIPFALYDAKFTAKLKDRSVPPLHQLLNHKGDTGTWVHHERR